MTLQLQIVNFNAGDYPDPPADCDLSEAIDINLREGPKWWNYFLCGVKGVMEDTSVSGDQTPHGGSHWIWLSFGHKLPLLFATVIK